MEGLAGNPLPVGSAGRAGSVVAVDVPPETDVLAVGMDDGTPPLEPPVDVEAPPPPLPPEPPLGGDAGALPVAGTEAGGPPPCELLLPWASVFPETQHSDSRRIITRDMTTSQMRDERDSTIAKVSSDCRNVLAEDILQHVSNDRRSRLHQHQIGSGHLPFIPRMLR